MKDALAKLGLRVRVTSALRIDQVCDQYARHRAVAWLDRGEVVIMAAGTGNPFFTTDSAASLRAIEVGADLLIKATKVNGVYSADPVKCPDAEFFPTLSYDHVLEARLGVMDATAVVLCRDHRMPMRVMNINVPGALKQLIEGQDIGTLVTASGDSQ
jgi:uridylate kinase